MKENRNTLGPQRSTTFVNRSNIESNVIYPLTVEQTIYKSIYFPKEYNLWNVKVC